MEKLTPEIKKLLLAAYSLGFWDKESGLQEFNGHKTEEKKLGWIEDCLFIEKETENSNFWKQKYISCK